MGTLVDTRKIAGLPLNGRDFFQLASLVPGAQLPAGGSQNSTLGGAVSINGAREQANNFLLDGVDNNDLYINQIVVPPALDSVQEFKIQSGSYNAEYGRSAGGQFNVVTKGGTNAWRGSAYGFFRDETLDARNYFDDPDRPIPEFGRQQFGVTFGGPLQRDRLFVFGSYEGTRVDKAYTRVATVPPMAWRQGDFSSLLTGRVNPATGLDYGQLFNPYTRMPFFGNVIPSAYIDPAGAAILDFYPVPDNPAAASPSSAIVAPVGRDNLDQTMVKVDRSVGAGRLFARYSYLRQDRFNPFDLLMDQTNVPGFGSNNRNRGQNVAIGWTRAIGKLGVERSAGGVEPPACRHLPGEHGERRVVGPRHPGTADTARTGRPARGHRRYHRRAHRTDQRAAGPHRHHAPGDGERVVDSREPHDEGGRGSTRAPRPLVPGHGDARAVRLRRDQR